MKKLGLFQIWIFIFSFCALAHSFSADFYLLGNYDSALKSSFTLSIFWLTGLLFFIWLAQSFQHLKTIFLSTWFLLFSANIIFWVINLGVIKFSGSGLTPFMLNHVGGSGPAFWSTFKLPAIYSLVFIFLLSFFLLWSIFFRLRKVKLETLFKNRGRAAVFILALLVFGGAWTGTPEHLIYKTFADDFYKGENNLSLNTTAKLKKFGLKYRPEDFFVSYRKHVAEKKILPSSHSFNRKTPNVIIFFLESFSADLTSVYDERFEGITPGLEKMAQNKNTTIFNNFYNSTTPTLTGLVSHLCSFLPPTEVFKEPKFLQDKLFCLPTILKKNGFKENFYVTAVEKNYSNKGDVLIGTGIDKVYGKDELANYIAEEPLAWGFSDHQMLPFLFDRALEAKGPFFAGISTIDSHQPYNIARDSIDYRDGEKDVLNSIHTTDDAFSDFWDSFVASDLYENTILVAVADHAAFPTAYDEIEEYFPEDLNKSFYDRNLFLMYVPNSFLPKKVNSYSASVDMAPTLLHVMGIDSENSFEGHSIFDNAEDNKNIIGFNEFQIYSNEVDKSGERIVRYKAPAHMSCREDSSDKQELLTECDYLSFYSWKRNSFEEGRFFIPNKNLLTAE